MSCASEILWGAHFEQAGWSRFPLLALALVSAVAAIALPAKALGTGSRRRARVYSAVLMALGVAALAIGAVGRAYYLYQSDTVAVQVEAENAEHVRRIICYEARMPLILGLLAGLVPLTVGVSLVGWGLGRPGSETGLLTASTVVVAVGLAVVLAGLAGREIATHYHEGCTSGLCPTDSPTPSIAFARDLWLPRALAGLPLVAGGAGLLGAGLLRRSRRDAVPQG